MTSNAAPLAKTRIVVAVRSPVGKAPRGSLRDTRPDEIAATVIRGALERVPDLPLDRIDDVLLGCAFPESEQGMNVARIASLRAGLPDHVSAMTINRFCSSGLQSIALAAQNIALGLNRVVVAGGVESMSRVPMEGHHFSPNPALVREDPDAYLSMGLTAENVARKYSISRLQQDEFSLRSHHNALAAQAGGQFDRELIPLQIRQETLEGGTKRSREVVFAADEGPRADTSLEALAGLRPVFHARGSVTAGNCSQRSDGAATAILASQEICNELGLEPQGRLLSFASAGVAPEYMGIGPVEAVPKALRLAGLEQKDVGLIELNEAFAAQALAVIQELGVDPKIVNVNGGAIALGHPLGASGAKLTATLLAEMERRGIRYGLVTMCIGGGMGAAGVVECLRV